MVRDYRLFLNDIELQYGNNKSLDFDLKNQSNWDVMSQDIGNKSQLTDWSSELKSQDLALYLPWFYSHDKSDAFPLKYCGNGDRLHHSVEFNLSLSQLLLIRDSDGNLVDFDKDLLTVSGNLDSVPIPEMEGLYSLLTNKEVDISDGKADEVNGEKELFTRSTYYIEDENDVPMGKKVQLKIDTKSRQPVYSVYWGAVNKTKSDELKPMFCITEKMTKISAQLNTLNSKLRSELSWIARAVIRQRELIICPETQVLLITGE